MVGKSVVCLSFMRYCARAAFIRFGKKVRYWMIFNEINSAFLFPVLSHEIIPKTGAANKQVIFQALRHQFIASSKAVRITIEKGRLAVRSDLIDKYSFHRQVAFLLYGGKIISQED